MKAWKARDFINDVQGADPMGNIISRVAKYWNKYRQRQIIATLNAIFAISGNEEWAKHTHNIATATEEVTDANEVSATTLNEAMTNALGDNKGAFALVVMHSQVAKKLENLQLLEYRKYTDAAGIERQMTIADYNGKLVVIDDGVTVTDSATATGKKEYTTYVLGNGTILMGKGKQSYPVETVREATKNGGEEMLITRVTEAIVPNGFSFEPATTKLVYEDADFANTENWKIKAPVKTIAMARIISNG